MAYILQSPEYTLQPGNPNPANFTDVKDPNFGKEQGHLDEINPSTGKNFGGLNYNQKIPDTIHPAYSEKDRFPETKTQCKPADTSDAKEIKLNSGEYKINLDPKALKVDCLKSLDFPSDLH